MTAKFVRFVAVVTSLQKYAIIKYNKLAQYSLIDKTRNIGYSK